jgi:hypothetical protein
MKKSRGYAEEYDGVGEIWWESEKDFLEAVTSLQGQELRKMFVEDEARFVDLEKSSGFFTVEHVLVDHSLPIQNN